MEIATQVTLNLTKKFNLNYENNLTVIFVI